jgi:hypothetical protein
MWKCSLYFRCDIWKHIFWNVSYMWKLYETVSHWKLLFRCCHMVSSDDNITVYLHAKLILMTVVNTNTQVLGLILVTLINSNEEQCLQIQLHCSVQGHDNFLLIRQYPYITQPVIGLNKKYWRSIWACFLLSNDAMQYIAYRFCQMEFFI